MRNGSTVPASKGLEALDARKSVHTAKAGTHQPDDDATAIDKGPEKVVIFDFDQTLARYHWWGWAHMLKIPNTWIKDILTKETNTLELEQEVLVEKMPKPTNNQIQIQEGKVENQNPGTLGKIKEQIKLYDELDVRVKYILLLAIFHRNNRHNPSSLIYNDQGKIFPFAHKDTINMLNYLCSDDNYNNNKVKVCIASFGSPIIIKLILLCFFPEKIVNRIHIDTSHAREVAKKSKSRGGHRFPNGNVLKPLKTLYKNQQLLEIIEKMYPSATNPNMSNNLDKIIFFDDTLDNVKAYNLLKQKMSENTYKPNNELNITKNEFDRYNGTDEPNVGDNDPRKGRGYNCPRTGFDEECNIKLKKFIGVTSDLWEM